MQAVENQHELTTMGFDLRHRGFDFSDTWWIAQPSISNFYWENYQREIGINLVSYRFVEEALDGVDLAKFPR